MATIRKFTPKETKELLKGPGSFAESTSVNLDEYDNPSFWCEICKSYHPDTTTCVDGTQKSPRA